MIFQKKNSVYGNTYSKFSIWHMHLGKNINGYYLLLRFRNVKNVQRMKTAVKLNEVIRENSETAKLVIVNLPPLPKAHSGGNEDLHCILLKKQLFDIISFIIIRYQKRFTTVQRSRPVLFYNLLLVLNQMLYRPMLALHETSRLQESIDLKVKPLRLNKNYISTLPFNAVITCVKAWNIYSLRFQLNSKKTYYM